MAIEAKAMFLKDMEQQLSTKITASDMSKVLSIVADQLANYSVTYSVMETQPDDLLDAYTAAMRIEGRSEKTVERYRYLIKRMMKDVKVPTRNITAYHLRQYLVKEKERGIADSTLEGIRQVFSAYFNWLCREHLIDSNPTVNLGTIKCQKKIKEIYSPIDIERMKFGCKTLRDRAIISFLMSTGCRISEMTQLNRTDIDLANLECKVLGKGNKERTVYIDQVTAMLIRDYLNGRMDSSNALFIGKGTDRISPHGVRAMMKRIENDSQVHHVHPHKFRRTLATNLIRHGMSIQEVASILGHDKIDTTMEYVVLDKSDIKNAYRKYA